jgi:hypothetical protein
MSEIVENRGYSDTSKPFGSVLDDPGGSCDANFSQGFISGIIEENEGRGDRTASARRQAGKDEGQAAAQAAAQE